MSNYTKATNFATKDTLPTGDSGKIVKGTEIDNELNAIASAVSSKADTASPTFTGTPAGPTAASGTNTTQLATTAFVKAAVDAGDATLNSSKADKTTTITAGTGLSGGGDLSANRSIALANTAVTAGTYGSASELVQVVVDAQGRITSAQEFNLPAPSVITQQSYAIDTTHSISVSGTNRPIALTLSFSSNQSSDDTISVGFEWGLGGLTGAYTFFNSQRVNFQVSPSGTITVYLTPSATTTLQFRVNTSGGGWHFRNFFVSAIQL
jgi:NAD(P)H-hydrate repair Nnr-like enzyme with NAD(P)H-hydrate epimerase domain